MKLLFCFGGLCSLSSQLQPHRNKEALLTLLRWLKKVSFTPQYQPHKWGLDYSNVVTPTWKPSSVKPCRLVKPAEKKPHIYLSHRCVTSNQCRYSHRWICSSLPYRRLDSCRGDFHTVFQAACYKKVWCQRHFVPQRSDVCPYFCHQWKGRGRSQHNHSWAWRSRAQWGGWGWCGRWGVPLDTCHPQGRGSRSHHWLWMVSFCCWQRWCLCRWRRRGFYWLFLIWTLEGRWFTFRNESCFFFF